MTHMTHCHDVMSITLQYYVWHYDTLWYDSM